jgi:hypothetical protein
MAQKPMLQAEVYVRALRANKNVKKAEVVHVLPEPNKRRCGFELN